MDCEDIVEEVNIYVDRQDNVTVRFWLLEEAGFRPCLEDKKLHLITEWVKCTHSNDNKILQQMKDAGVTKYSISYPKRRFDNFPVPLELTD